MKYLLLFNLDQRGVERCTWSWDEGVYHGQGEGIKGHVYDIAYYCSVIATIEAIYMMKTVVWATEVKSIDRLDS